MMRTLAAAAMGFPVTFMCGLFACTDVADSGVGVKTSALENAPEDTRHKWAVGVCGGPLADGASGVCTASRCTGTLIAPNLVLTARHCVNSPTINAPTELCLNHQDNFFDPGAVKPPSAMHVTVDPSTIEGAPRWYNVSEILLPPGTRACDDDIALLVLTTNIPASETPPIAADIYTDVANHRPRALAIVGRGAIAATFDPVTGDSVIFRVATTSAPRDQPVPQDPGRRAVERLEPKLQAIGPARRHRDELPRDCQHPAIAERLRAGVEHQVLCGRRQELQIVDHGEARAALDGRPHLGQSVAVVGRSVNAHHGQRAIDGIREPADGRLAPELDVRDRARPARGIRECKRRLADPGDTMDERDRQIDVRRSDPAQLGVSSDDDRSRAGSSTDSQCVRGVHTILPEHDVTIPARRKQRGGRIRGT
jgi:hypothetical protein